MKLDEQDLKRLFEDPAAYPSRSARGCPEPQSLARILAKESSAAERRAFADHLVACPDCAAEYRLASSLGRWAGEAAVLVGGQDRLREEPRRSRPRVWIAAAAAVVAAAGLAVLFFQGLGHATDTAVERGASLVTQALDPKDHANLSAPPPRLAWAAMEGAESYEVTIYDAESTPIWKSGPVTGTEIEVPASVRERLVPGRSYLWRVVGRVGLEQRTSPVFEFGIATSP